MEALMVRCLGPGRSYLLTCGKYLYPVSSVEVPLRHARCFFWAERDR